ncbi:MAG: aminotransferase class V-fold PLP-dependent enzyme [bacterium]|nr:aminotransferase class V-fold PLP-dependent enzyme [bacterium]
MRYPHSRRSFLTALGTGAALMPAAGAAADETYWSMVRSRFPFTEERVPMNAANLCPSPRAVADRVAALTRDIDVDCSFQNRAKFKEALEQSRAKVARQLGARADEIALVRNTSEANNIVNNGLPLRSGDEVVLWDQNHPTNNVAWDVRAARFGTVVKRVSTPSAPSGIDELVGVFERAFTARTRVLAITQLSNLTGIRLPVRELCDVAHGRGIYVHVDGAQTWGALDVNLRELDCDSYSASAHKWFCGPKEAGILYVKADRIPEIWPNTVAPGWGDDTVPDVVGARKFESSGQRDDACLAAVGTAADFHAAIGAARREARILELATELKDRIADAGVKVLTPREPELSGGVCIIEASSENGREAWDRLYTEHGIAGATTGGLRLCPHIYNTMDHVHRAARGMTAMRGLLV